MPIISRYDRSESRRLLDWGCGSGRLSIHIATKHPDIQLSGCDIDAEAVQWCRENIDTGDFQVIHPLPPTAYQDGQFTSIVGYSIVTHLSREHQHAWITELHRLLATDGIAIVTTMGAHAAKQHGLAQHLDDEGIIDDRLDSTLDDITPAGYYRSTFQSRAFTEHIWGERFEIIEYREAAAFSFQDIVVLRKRA